MSRNSMLGRSGQRDALHSYNTPDRSGQDHHTHTFDWRETMKSRARFLIVFLMAVMAAIPVMGSRQNAHAQPPDSSGNGRPVSIDPGFKPRLGTYYYKFDYNNVSIGFASITIDKESDLYRIQVNAQTNSTIDRIYRIRYRGESLMDADPRIASIQTKTQQQVKSTEKDMTIQFQQDGGIKTIEKKSKNGSTVDYDVRSLMPEKFTVDPFAATYLVRGLDWKVGREEVFDVYGGKSQYELHLKCSHIQGVDVDGAKRPAYVIIPTVKKLDKDGNVVESKKKPADTKIYLSADELKDVLKIEATHTLGFFRVTLDRFVPLVPQEQQAQPQDKVQTHTGG